MPELPDVTVYVEHLARRVVGETLERVRVSSPNLLRTAQPPLREAEGKGVREVRRLGKRIVFALEDDLFLVLHLMIAGRLHWKEGAAARPETARWPRPAPKNLLASFVFANGTLLLTEASTRKRASLHLVRGVDELALLDAGGVEPLEASTEEFRRALTRESHTVKRALTDPRLFRGIGNAYSDEILHRARMSPLTLTGKLSEEDIERLRQATRAVLMEWTERLREQAGADFPEKVTAFRPEMAVHGRHKLPCPVCGTPVQRIVYAENETNYCPRCQTGGRLLADRSLSRLLRADWPRTIEEWEEGRASTSSAGGAEAGPARPRSPSRRGVRFQ